MALPFEGKLLVSDIDGTLLHHEDQIPQRNIDAIRRFQEGGGLFTLATGRAWQSTAHLLELLQPKAPGIFLNGASLYDVASKTYVAESFLPTQADAFLQEMFERFPQAALKVFCRDTLGMVRENEYSEYHRRVVVAPQKKMQIYDLPQKKYKVLWMADADIVAKMRQWYQENAPKGTHAFCSCAQYFEIMPYRIDKGSGLRKLQEVLKIKKEDTIAIGDYENDVAMLRSAGLSAAPANADSSAKAQAKLIVGDCTNGALADLIEYLERKQNKEGLV